MMRQSGAGHDYLNGNGFAALRLRYHGGASMYAFLPDRDSNLPEFMDGLDTDAWAEWMEGFREGGGELVLPRFEMEYDERLNDVLSAWVWGLPLVEARTSPIPALPGSTSSA